VRDTPLDDMADTDRWCTDGVKGEYTISCLLNCSDETLVGDGHLIVLAENRDDAVFL
jgi:hypothetical protein